MSKSERVIEVGTLVLLRDLFVTEFQKVYPSLTFSTRMRVVQMFVPATDVSVPLAHCRALQKNDGVWEETGGTIIIARVSQLRFAEDPVGNIKPIIGETS